MSFLPKNMGDQNGGASIDNAKAYAATALADFVTDITSLSLDAGYSEENAEVGMQHVHRDW